MTDSMRVAMRRKPVLTADQVTALRERAATGEPKAALAK